jgi:hypothetical protein
VCFSFTAHIQVVRREVFSLLNPMTDCLGDLDLPHSQDRPMLILNSEILIPYNRELVLIRYIRKHTFTTMKLIGSPARDTVSMHKSARQLSAVHQLIVHVMS